MSGFKSVFLSTVGFVTSEDFSSKFSLLFVSIMSFYSLRRVWGWFRSVGGEAGDFFRAGGQGRTCGKLGACAVNTLLKRQVRELRCEASRTCGGGSRTYGSGRSTCGQARFLLRFSCFSAIFCTFWPFFLHIWLYHCPFSLFLSFSLISLYPNPQNISSSLISRNPLGF